MKRKFVVLTLSLLISATAIIGCGKSDEEKAREEIMSHMDADEKANIEADQKQISEWEEEQQAKQEAAAASAAALPEYSEAILDTIDIEWTTPLKVTFVSAEYYEFSTNDIGTFLAYNSEISKLELTCKILDSDGGAMSYAKSVADSGAEDSVYEEIGTYTIGGYDKGGNIHTILITDSENACLALEFWTTDDEIRKDIYNRNLESIRTQLEAIQ